MDERFGELVYDAWRSGRSPDQVSEERYDEMLASGYAPEEIQVVDVMPSPASPMPSTPLRVPGPEELEHLQQTREALDGD